MSIEATSRTAKIEERASERGENGSWTWHLFILLTAAITALFSRFLHGATYWSFFEDDFFYYAEVAKRLVLTHSSTFDGTHLTNGYHPLWLIVLAFLYRISPGMLFFVAAQAVGLAATIVFYFAAIRCLAAFEVEPAVRRVAALVLSLHTLLLFRYGMEVTLTLPLGFCMLAHVLSPAFRWSTRQTLFYGLLASLTILSRLDSIFLIALVLLAQMVMMQASGGERLRRLAVFCIGGLLFPLYLTTNLVIFHTLLPISGMAKQLKPLLPPSAEALRDFVVHPDRAKIAFAYTALVAIGAGIYFLLRERDRRTKQQNALLAALFFFPVIHIGVLCLMSDWHLWPWYYYSLTFAVFAAMVAMLNRKRFEFGGVLAHSRTDIRIMGALSTLLVLYVVAYSVGKKPPAFALFSGFVADFSQAHPGTVAMGDCAGAAGYRSNSAVVQLEGLMMDRPYLDLVKARTPLREVLKLYPVEYYATIENPIEQNGCFIVHEPAQAGPASPKMLGRICAKPLASTQVGTQSVGIFHASDVLLP